MVWGHDRREDIRVAWPVWVGDETRLVHTVESRENVVCDRVGTIFNSQLPETCSHQPGPTS